MEALRKVNSVQLYWLWRNFAIALLCMGGTIAATHMLPFYFAPVVSLLACGVLYTMIWNSRRSETPSDMTAAVAMLYALFLYTAISVAFVVMHVFKVYPFHDELIFFNEPYMPSLILLPSAFCTSLLMLISKTARKFIGTGLDEVCQERGYFALIAARENTLQLRNMVLLFLILSGVIWWYFLHIYVDVDLNGRDWYVFVWIVIFGVLIDEIYFIARYYNLYLDLKENDEIITPDELRDITAKTYIRTYAVCGEYMYIVRDAEDRLLQRKGVVDTPFVSKRNVNGVPTTEVRNIVEKMTGVKGGELKFFFGRHLEGQKQHSLLRYFYFLDGSPQDYPLLGNKGEWVNFNDLKLLYANKKEAMASTAVHDLSRLATIILTERVFDENGHRRNKIKSYRQHLSLADVRNTHIDLQDDKWIRIANFNSDAKFFRLKKALRGLFGKKLQNISQR